jgi:hypothetical protein
VQYCTDIQSVMSQTSRQRRKLTKPRGVGPNGFSRQFPRRTTLRRSAHHPRQIAAPLSRFTLSTGCISQMRIEPVTDSPSVGKSGVELTPAFECKRLLTPDRVWSRSEVLSAPSPVPKPPGVYAWYFCNFPPEREYDEVARQYAVENACFRFLGEV